MTLPVLLAKQMGWEWIGKFFNWLELAGRGLGLSFVSLCIDVCAQNIDIQRKVDSLSLLCASY